MIYEWASTNEYIMCDSHVVWFIWWSCLYWLWYLLFYLGEWREYSNIESRMDSIPQWVSKDNHYISLLISMISSENPRSFENSVNILGRRTIEEGSGRRDAEQKRRRSLMVQYIEGLTVASFLFLAASYLLRLNSFIWTNRDSPTLLYFLPPPPHLL